MLSKHIASRVSSAFRGRWASTLVHVHGATGRLGTEICNIPDTEALAHRSPDPIAPHNIDVVVDTSLPAGLSSLIGRLIAGGEKADKDAKLPVLLVGSTGDLPMDDINKYAERAPVYLCPNFSTGVRVLLPTLKAFGADPTFTTAVTDIHHTEKVDSPSGTAKLFAGALQTSQVNSIRAHDVKGIHKVDIIGHLESVEITHTAHDRRVFAAGAVELAKKLADQRSGGKLENGLHDPFDVLKGAPSPAMPASKATAAPTVYAAPKAVKQTPTAKTQKIQKLRLMTAIKTPYQDNGAVDLPTFDKHVEHQLANGVEGLIIGGTTGEGHLFSWTEHIMLIAHTKNKFGDRCAVIGNTGSNCTGEAISSTEHGFSVGMDASLTINPYYGKTNAEGIKRHILASMELGPAIIYNVPSRTGQDIHPSVMFELASHPNFCGVKECMGPDRIKPYADAGVKVWSGNDDDMHYCRHVLGAQGSISVLSNVVPGLCSQLLHGPRNDELNEKLIPLMGWLFKEPNPIGVNTLMMQLGMARPVFRLPYVPLDKDMREEGIRILKEVGLEHAPNGSAIRAMEDDEFTVIGDYYGMR